MAKREAEFSEKIKLTLKYLSKNKCSNPACNIETTDIDKDGMVYYYGKSSHIEAASPKGPRYNPNSTLNYRKSIHNAIWLCSNCADKIDKDVKRFPTELLKEWKRRAECIDGNAKSRIFAIANQAGGVGKSTVTAFLAQAFADITNENVLCISVEAYDFVGDVLFEYNKREYRGKETIVSTKKYNVDYMGDKATRKFFNECVENNGRLDFSELTAKYKYIFIDCGNGVSDAKLSMFHIASDIVIPIGEVGYSYRGIYTLRLWLENKKEKVTVWPIYSLGLRLSNEEYCREWFYKVWKEINCIAKEEMVELCIPTVIIPKTHYMKQIIIDIKKTKKTRCVAEAYLLLANEMLDNNDTSNDSSDFQL